MTSSMDREIQFQAVKWLVKNNKLLMNMGNMLKKHCLVSTHKVRKLT